MKGIARITRVSLKAKNINLKLIQKIDYVEINMMEHMAMKRFSSDLLMVELIPYYMNKGFKLVEMEVE